jgi:hypothetical protein
MPHLLLVMVHWPPAFREGRLHDRSCDEVAGGAVNPVGGPDRVRQDARKPMTTISARFATAEHLSGYQVRRRGEVSAAK